MSKEKQEMRYSTNGMDLEGVGKICLPTESESNEGILLQLQRIAREEGLKYRTENVATGMVPKWISTVTPVFYRRVFNSPVLTKYEPLDDSYSNPKIPDILRNALELRDPSTEDFFKTYAQTEAIVYIEPNHFFIRKGEQYSNLRRKLREWYRITDLIGRCDRDVEKGRELVERLEQEEIEREKRRTRVPSKKLRMALMKHVGWYLKNRLQNDDSKWSYWDFEHDLAKSWESTSYNASYEMRDTFEDTPEVKRIRKEYHERWDAEGTRIILPRGWSRINVLL